MAENEIGAYCDVIKHEIYIAKKQYPNWFL